MKLNKNLRKELFWNWADEAIETTGMILGFIFFASLLIGAVLLVLWMLVDFIGNPCGC